MIVPDSAHGTNPATVRIAGYEVLSYRLQRTRGMVDTEALGPHGG